MSDQSISSTELHTAIHTGTTLAVFDVRKKPAFEQDPGTLPTATWQIHDDVKTWAARLSLDQRVIVYCVHGHEVSQNTARALRDMGFDACYLQGGIDGWKQAGLPIEMVAKK